MARTVAGTRTASGTRTAVSGNVLDQSQTSFFGSNVGYGQFANVRYRSQTFVPNSNIIVAVMFWIAGIGSTGRAVEIYEVGADHNPMGDPINQTFIAQGDLVAAPHIYTLTTPCTVTPGTEYALVFWPQTSGSYVDNYQNHKYGSINNTRPYTRGYNSQNNNGAWASVSATNSMYFAVYSDRRLIL